jgi:hypothetical protein
MRNLFLGRTGWRNSEVECMIQSDVEVPKKWACATLHHAVLVGQCNLLFDQIGRLD